MTPVIRLFRASSSRTSHHTKSWDTFARYRPSFLCTPFLSALLIVPVPLQPGQQVPLVSSALSSLGPHRNLSRSHEPGAAEKQVHTAEGAPAVRKYLVQGRRHGGQRGQNSAAAGVPAPLLGSKSCISRTFQPFLDQAPARRLLRKQPRQPRD